MAARDDRAAGSKGAVQFPLGQPRPLDLSPEGVKFRVQKNLARAAAQGKQKAKE